MQDLNIRVRAEVDFEQVDYLDESYFNNSKYAIGIGFADNNKTIIMEDRNEYPIKEDTRSIHISDMKDSENNPIFASLQSNKKYGDIIHNIINPENFGDMIVFWNEYRNAVCYDEKGNKLEYLLSDELKNYKVIGIQE